MGKYNIYVTPAADILSKRIMGDAEKVRASADTFNTHSDLTDIGRSDLTAFKDGRVGDTMLGRALGSAAARANESVRNSYSIGATALAGGSNPNSSLVYSRMADRAMRRNQEAAMDRLATALPGYTNAAGGWADTDNQLLERKNRIFSQASELDADAFRVQNAGTTVEKKKSIWEKIGAGVKFAAGVAGAFMNPAAGITGGLSGMFGDGAAVGGIGAATGNASGAVDAAKRLL